MSAFTQSRIMLLNLHANFLKILKISGAVSKVPPGPPSERPWAHLLLLIALILSGEGVSQRFMQILFFALNERIQYLLYQWICLLVRSAALNLGFMLPPLNVFTFSR